MTVQQMRDIPIGGKVWYSRVTMCEKPSIQLYINDRPRVITKVEDLPERRRFPCFRVTGMPRGSYLISYDYDGAEIQKATKEIAKRKREYCKNANAYAKKIQADAIKQMNDFLNRGDVDAN